MTQASHRQLSICYMSYSKTGLVEYLCLQKTLSPLQCNSFPCYPSKGFCQGVNSDCRKNIDGTFCRRRERIFAGLPSVAGIDQLLFS
ncbi:hypothetical protein O6P43_013321 [Quillaja saponaria]|uniref:Uncharacterized protein n=1 Tax=Quillaja saponaria TaxID=32244 RepID=A0AAD7PWI4_QUISA|nr:hypothetical protein O6P43_013321 [Quillaja saponaria]